MHHGLWIGGQDLDIPILLSEYVKTFKTMSDEDIENLIKECNNLKYGKVNNSKLNNYVNLKNKISLDNNSISNQSATIIQKSISKAFNLYKQFCPFEIPNNLVIEKYCLRKYPKGFGKFDSHFDCKGNCNDRLFGVVGYLNTCYTGETEFPHLNIKISPKKGHVLIFPASWEFTHKVSTPLEDRYCFVSFIKLNINNNNVFTIHNHTLLL